MSVDEIKSMVMRFVDEPWNKGNLDVIDELCAPDYTVTSLASKWKGGREDLKDAIRKTRTYPDFNAEVDEIIIEGNRVAYLWNMTGTNEKGKFETYIGITLLRLEEGKIVEDRYVAGTLAEETSSS